MSGVYNEDLDLAQKLCPEEWRKYCDLNWGTPEEQQAFEEEEQRLRQGWQRGSDGELYNPNWYV